MSKRFLNAKFINNKAYVLFQLKDKSDINKRFYRLIERSNSGERFIDINNIFIDDDLNAYNVGKFYVLRKQSVSIGILIAAFSVGTISAFITVNPISFSYNVFDDMLFGKIIPEDNIA